MIWLKRIALVLLIIFLGTILDYIFHSFHDAFFVPFSYYTHKVAFGLLWAFLGYLVFKKYIKTHTQLAFVMSATAAILLQVFYFIKGHQPVWIVLLFLFLHFLMFLLPGYYICKKYKHVFL